MNPSEMSFYQPDHDAFRVSVREFVQREISPFYLEWEEQHLVDRTAFAAAGAAGVLGTRVEEAYGGGGTDDYRFRFIVAEELASAGAASYSAGLAVQEDIVIPYVMELGSEEQKRRWLPGLTSGNQLGAIAMTEPGAGSDLQGTRTTAVRDGDEWLISGQKTFITNGIQSDTIVVLARTNPDAGSRGFSLFVVEAGDSGFSRGRKLDKIGLVAQDTAELFFEKVRVGRDRLLGEEGNGLRYLMERLPLERLSIAVAALCSAEAAYGWARDYVFERQAFSQDVGDFQTVRFTLAEIETELEVTRAYVEAATLKLNRGSLTAVDAAKAKWWASELQQRVINRSLQLFGGYGYMLEYPIARAYRDARIQTIYGGTTEIMKEIIGRDIAARAKRR
ncbi:acyl-CoA dehydrogenase family protein [Nocardioides sp. NBC_00850]|uniref:acyl-CoA dehydrogenase family protein n=1 Tax=Nocardioides sp. NBC_00850 TaxID=2976001 RepID=UPI003870D7AB|nr:acyl-CoA dehydrogenase family protein [Nocardioides sp. NBC_00850]